jgi:hypothetical protein
VHEIKTPLEWNENCFCPVKGKMELTISPLKTSNANIEFTGCGTLTVNYDTESRSFQLPNCS